MAHKDKKKDKEELSVDQILDSIRGVINSKELKAPKRPILSSDNVLELTEIYDKEDKESSDYSLLDQNTQDDTIKIIDDFVLKATKNTKESHQSKNVEQLIKEIVKPELKTWLNRNLRSLVKEVVAEELSKLVSKQKK